LGGLVVLCGQLESEANFRNPQNTRRTKKSQLMTMRSQAVSRRNPIEDQIVETISWTLQVAPQRLLPYTHFVDDLHLDDIDMMLLIAALESQLDKYLTAEQVQGIATIGDVTKCFSDN
jgi:acyl carrier protein